MNLKKPLTYFYLVALMMTLQNTIFSQDKSLADKAQEALNAGDWAKSEEFYNKITRDDPLNGQAWLSLGISYYWQEEYDNALEAYSKAENNGIKNNVRLFAQMGISYVQVNKIEKSYEYLEKAVNIGLPPNVLKTHQKLTSLQNEDRFKGLVEKSEKIAFPCKHDKFSRQFDFWVGEWDVYTTGGKVAESKIEYSLEGCLIIENYKALGGAYAGKSMNFYDVSDSNWHQIWTDQSGNLSRYTGGLKDGKMYLNGKNIDRSGTWSDVRMIFTPNPDGSVRQLYEGSNDKGQTWITYFDGKYVRKPQE